MKFRDWLWKDDCLYRSTYIHTIYTGPSEDYEVEETEAAPRDSEGGATTEAEALERLARAGHWTRCLAHAGLKAPHYALRYAAHLFKAHPVRSSKNLN